jgi:protein-S-isoprenylcysteine O-methyltransferase Ste14
MGGLGRRHHRTSWRLSPWGRILALALVVLVILAVVTPSTGVFLGLAAVILIWAGLLASSFPSTRAMYNHTIYTTAAAADDLGQEAAEKYDQERGLD